MPLDITPYQRPPCKVCGTAARRPGFATCAACAAQAIARQQAYLDAVWAETQAYKRPSPPPTPPASPGRPTGSCPRCGGVWMDRSGPWSCRACGFDPLLPDGPRWQAALYEVPEPVAPVPPAWICGVCGPVAVWTHDDGSQQCSLCGARRS
jgi:hypothetical protein